MGSKSDGSKGGFSGLVVRRCRRTNELINGVLFREKRSRAIATKHSIRGKCWKIIQRAIDLRRSGQADVSDANKYQTLKRYD